jgi:hypothetical protein
MNLLSPATSFIAAVDEPWRFLGRNFSRCAPAAFGLAAFGVLPALLVQWAGSQLTGAVPGEMNLGALGWLYGGLFLTAIVYVTVQLSAFIIVRRVLDGETPQLLAVLGELASLRLLVLGGGVLVASLVGFSCIVPGPLLMGLLGLVPVAIVAAPGPWLATVTDAVTVSTRRVSATDSGAPLWKLAVVSLTWWALTATVGQLAALPTGGWMMWHMFSTLGEGNFLAAMQVQPPFPVSALAAVLGAAMRPFSDLYLAAAATLLWRDVKRVRQGDDLQALVDANA